MTTAQGELDMNDINASLHLEGLRLTGGWTVGSRSDGDSVAGTFSVSYTARHDDGREGFVKVLDLVGVFADLEELGIAVNDYLAERDLLLICGAARMSRVVTALDHGKVTLEGFLPLLSTVHYIIFELADSDLNGVLSGSAVTDIAVRLELIHDLAVGVRQLHSRSVAHQDIKPANSLFFRGSDGDRDSSKISDLGRAFRPETSTSHSSALIPGDRSFAPLELLYGFAHPQLEVRRYSADLYQLGSLICYTFAGATMNGLVAERLNPDHHWDHFGDGYADALPYVQAAYASVIADLRETLPAPVSKEIATLIEYLCEPEPERRGHPRAKAGQGSAFALERVVSDLNLAAFRARSRSGPIT